MPVEDQIEALDWLHSQDQNVLPRCYFSGRSRVTISDFSSTDITNVNGNGNLQHISTSADDNELVSVAGVGSAVLFRSPNPFSFDDWLSIKRYCIQFFALRTIPLLGLFNFLHFLKLLSCLSLEGLVVYRISDNFQLIDSGNWVHCKVLKCGYWLFSSGVLLIIFQ